MSKNESIRIGLVDDHVLFREGMRDILSNEPGFCVTGEGSNGQEALTLASKNSLDVLLMDLRLPQMGGVPAIRRIRDFNQTVKIVVITMFEDEHHRKEAILAGADGYYSKMEESDVVIHGIRRLMQGKLLISKEERALIEKEGGEIGHHLDPTFILTDTELLALEGLCEGKNNRDLANGLCMGERTLKNHLNKLFKKMGVKNRLEAVKVGIQKKLVSFGT